MVPGKSFDCGASYILCYHYITLTYLTADYIRSMIGHIPLNYNILRQIYLAYFILNMCSIERQ